MHFLEQLTAEWLEYCGYFVRRHVRVEAADAAVADCELDVVAFHPESQHLLQVEASLETTTRRVRAQRFQKKFDAGRNYVPTMFRTLVPVREVDQVALVGYGHRDSETTVAGGRILFADELMTEIRGTLRDLPSLAGDVSDRFVCLRTIQLAMQSEIPLREGVQGARPLVRSGRGSG